MLEIIVLGLLAAYVVLLLIPSAFRIESDCVGEYGRERITGDSYVAAAAVVGTFGWLAVTAGAIYAQIAESTRLSLLLPLAWFVFFVGGFLVIAAAIGPQLCPS
ncbi:MAG: hypothetical protein WD380_08005 [Gaiellaceae bacterium]